MVELLLELNVKQTFSIKRCPELLNRTARTKAAIAGYMEEDLSECNSKNTLT